jgi:GH35 family endo-1,4-beta-xylanase
MNSTVEIADAPGLNPSGSFSVETWIKPAIALSLQTSWPRIVDKAFIDFSGVQSRRGWLLRVNGKSDSGPGKIGFEINDGTGSATAGGPTALTSAANLAPTDRWTHVAGVYSQEAGTITIYVNGALEGQTAVARGPAPSTGPLRIGSSAYSDFFAGLVDEVSLYNRALTHQEIEAIYRAGAAGKCTAAVQAPAILASPENRAAAVGENVRFQVLAAGTEPLHYQWLFNGTPLTEVSPFAGVYSNVLLIASAQAQNAGFYSVVVTNAGGAVTSSPAELRLAARPPGHTNLLLNPGFEQGTVGWAPFGSSVIQAPAGQATNLVHSGFRAVRVSGRTQTWEGVSQSLLGLVMPFKTYGISAWVRLENGGSQAIKLTVQEKKASGVESWNGVSQVTADTGRWVHLLGTYTLRSADPYSALTLYFEGPAAGVNFCVDDVVLEPLAHYDWRQVANAGIEQHRKRNVRLRVVDAAGTPQPDVMVRVRQTRPGFPFGSAINSSISNPQYAAFFRTNFEWAVMENESKWHVNQPQRLTTNYTAADAIRRFCQTNGIPLRGHCLFWAVSNNVQSWVKNLSDGDLRVALTNRLASAVSHFRGTFVHWDVNNEMLHGDYFSRRLGAWVDPWMFIRARELDPGVKLFVNDYDVVAGGRTQDYIDQLRRLQAANAPVDAIGVQGHFGATVEPWLVESRLDSLAELGLPIWITEYDSEAPDPVVRADNLEALYRVAFSKPAVQGVLMWGFWAGAHWRTNAAIVNLDWSLNEAGRRYQALRAEWRTAFTNITDAQGTLSFRGFHGDYEIDLETNGVTPSSHFLRLEAGAGVFEMVLTNLAAPQIVLQPRGGEVFLGGSISLNVEAIGSQPLFYRWFLNGEPVLNVPPYSGAFDSLLTISGAQPNHAGAYSVTVSNHAGAVTSSNITVTVLPYTNLLTNPGFEQGVVNWSPYGTCSLSTSTNNPHGGLASVLVQGRGDSWTGPGRPLTSLLRPSGVYRVSAWIRLASGSDADASLTLRQTLGGVTTYPHVCDGTASSTQWTQLIGLFTNAPTAPTELHLYLETPGSTVSFYADDFVVEPLAPPSIIEQPQSQTLPMGTSAELQVQAFGSAPLAFQWYRGDAGVTTSPIAGATTNTYTTPPISANSSFWVRISNAAGATNSAAAVITALPAPVLGLRSSPADGSIVTVFWPAWASGFRLSSAPELTDSMQWLSVLGVPTTNGSMVEMAVSATNRHRFFRLVAP